MATPAPPTDDQLRGTLEQVNQWELRTQAGSDRQAILLDVRDALTAQLDERARLEQVEAWVSGLVNAARVAFPGPDDTDASLLLSAASNLNRGLPVPGGSNLTNTVVHVLQTVANIVERERAGAALSAPPVKIDR